MHRGPRPEWGSGSGVRKPLGSRSTYTGIVVNEAADVLAEQMYEGDARITMDASMAHCGAKFTNMKGVRARMQEIVRGRLRMTTVESQYVEATDWQIPARLLSREHGYILELWRQQLLLYAAEKRFLGEETAAV